LNPVAWITSCPVPGKWQCATHRDNSQIKPDQIPPSLGPGARTRPAPVTWPRPRMRGPSSRQPRWSSVRWHRCLIC